MSVLATTELKPLSEFKADHLGVRVYDACLPDAVVMVLHVLLGWDLTGDNIHKVRNQMLAARNPNRFTVGSGAPLSSGVWYFEDVLKIPVHDYGFHEWYSLTELEHALSLLDENALAVLELGEAWRLPHNEGGVSFHFVVIRRTGPTTFKMANGDDFTATRAGGRLDFPPIRDVTTQQLLDAKLCGVFVVPLGTPTKVNPPMPIPTGWKDSANGDPQNDSGTLTAPNGIAVVHGDRQYILTDPNWQANDTPLASVHYPDANSSVQDFRCSSLGRQKDPKTGQWGDVVRLPIGEELAAANHQLGDLHQQIETLLTTIEQLKNQSTSGPDGAALDALAAVLAGRLPTHA